MTIDPLRPSQLDAVLALDREATGEDRGGFITALAGRGWVAARPGAVVGFHIACPWGGVTRMWLGAPPRWRPEMIFGVVNFGVG
jgi:hypothetical protein